MIDFHVAFELNLFRFSKTELIGEVVTYSFSNDFKCKITAFKHSNELIYVKHESEMLDIKDGIQDKTSINQRIT